MEIDGTLKTVQLLKYKTTEYKQAHVLSLQCFSCLYLLAVLKRRIPISPCLPLEVLQENELDE